MPGNSSSGCSRMQARLHRSGAGLPRELFMMLWNFSRDARHRPNPDDDQGLRHKGISCSQRVPQRQRAGTPVFKSPWPQDDGQAVATFACSASQLKARKCKKKELGRSCYTSLKGCL